MKRIIRASLPIGFVLCFSISAYAESAVESFFTTLSSLCGEKFQGSMTYPIDGQDSFKGKELVAEFATCGEQELRIPFNVGSDMSRTWIISKTTNGLRFKHKHLLKDGSVDPISNYGGDALVGGSKLEQSFPADEFTKKLIPEASSNVWTMSLSEDLKTLTYHLERHGKPRFTAVLARQ